MQIKHVEDLFLMKLSEMYVIEQEIIKALPKIIDAASSTTLKQGLANHLEETKDQAQKLEQIITELKVQPEKKVVQGILGILEDGEQILDMIDKTDPVLLDAAIIPACRTVEHYEMAGYTAAATYAQLLGRNDIAAKLKEILEQEKSADQTLMQAAMEINKEALRVEA